MASDSDLSQIPAAGGVSRLIAVAREQGRADAYIGKRRWTRYAVGMRLEVTVDPDTPGNTWLVRTHNISGGGLGFWSSREVKKGLTVHLREWSGQPGSPWVPGLVTYCTLGIGGYLVGVAFGAPDRPDSEFEQSGSAPLHENASAGAGLLSSASSLAIQCAARTALAAAVGVAVSASVMRNWTADGYWTPLVAIACACTTAGLLGWLMLRHEVAFLKVLQAAMRELASGSPSSVRLPAASSRELNGLRQAILDLGSKWRRHDDAERLQRQRLEELTRIKSNILSTVSHDLRTPLTSIILYTRMLTDELDTLPREDQIRFLGIISDECARLSRLLDDLLEVQRLESGRVQWCMKEQDLAGTFRKTASVFEVMARSNSIAFSVSCPDRLPPLAADADKMAQVVSNLLSNALKYTPAGGKVGFVVEASGDQILLCVTDNGPGIPRDKWDQIFDRFARLADTHTREIAGVGLGLYIVREIVERHGGRVWLDSEPGCGSQFYVSLPLSPAAPADPPCDPEGVPPGRVVFCDADPELVAVVAQTLRQVGLDVQVVHSGGRLLERLAQGEVDVLVTDVLLPDMTAPDLLDALEEHPNRSFKLVLHSYGDQDLPIKGGGVDVFLPRPASKEELVQAVRVCLQRKRFPDGRTILLVRGDEGDLAPLGRVLSARGHACLTALGLGAVEGLAHSYHLDLLVVDSRTLGFGWCHLRLLDPLRTDDLRIVVLTDEIRKTDRRLAETHGVSLVCCQEGSEAAAADALLDRKPAHAPEARI